MPSPPSGSPLPAPFRLALFYAATFAVSGVHQPFWPVWLKAHGQGDAAITVLLSAGVFVRILSNPFVAHLADRQGERRRPMLRLA
ncbi:MAG TPA: MFS transporter, partial [Candidatus Sulfotelmatobacter sp.]|nr:MFS transporter [Candidatus Sulfotelmatobacter sp.]